jgi:hypothetical protein
MTMQQDISTFFSSPAYAIVGASANHRKMGSVLYRTMRERGFNVYPVNPNINQLDGARVFPSVMELPDEVKSVVTVVPPEVTDEVMVDCVRKGIRSVWMQLGSQSKDAIDIARKYNLAVIHGQCLLMFLEPVNSVHAVHRWFKKLVGTYPG